VYELSKKPFELPLAAMNGRSTSLLSSSTIHSDGRRLEVRKQTFRAMAHEYLVIFQYHEPEPRQQFERGVIEDYESTTGVFIAAESADDALFWGEAIAQEVLWRCNDDRSLDWKHSGYTCWIESDPDISSWSHCLGFFQHVRIGEMPNVDAMGTDAYVSWQKR
jgi:hypothetical protein